MPRDDAKLMEMWNDPSKEEWAWKQFGWLAKTRVLKEKRGGRKGEMEGGRKGDGRERVVFRDNATKLAATIATLGATMTLY